MQANRVSRLRRRLRRWLIGVNEKIVRMMAADLRDAGVWDDNPVPVEHTLSDLRESLGSSQAEKHTRRKDSDCRCL